VTDEHGCETVFGFLKYPVQLRDVHGTVRAELPTHGRWFYRDFLNSPDRRYRQIVRRFAEAGFVEQERDEFAWA
jgi:cation transport regulator ChaB